METLLVDEIRALGAEELKSTRAGVRFKGTLETAYRACLWSRVANRILLPIKSFPAPTPEKLYGGVKSIRWSEHLLVDQTLAVDFSTSKSKITHSQFGALKVKDAIVDQFRSVRGARPSVDVDRPDLRINVYLYEDEATVSIDLSGDSLHRRGYRDEGVKAPLKENLAAAILLLAEWAETSKEGFSLLDPMCGSGTLLIEAAMIAGDIAPGIDRGYYGFSGWKGHDASIWDRLLKEADQRAEDGKGRIPRIVGYDEDPAAIRAAIENIENAGLRGGIHVEKRELSNAEPVSEKGLLVTNPPYGERLGETEELKPLYKKLGDTLKQKFKGWTGYIFTGSPELSKCIGLHASRRFVLYNGAIECRLFKYELF